MSFFTNCILAFTAHVYKCKERYHPLTPPTPDKLRSIQHVYKCKERYHPPTPPTPDKLRSIQHVYKCKERYHSPTPPHPPHPPQTSCVAFNMCTSARNVIIPPPHPPQTSCVAFNMCTSARNVIIPPPHPHPKKAKNLRGRSGTRQHKQTTPSIPRHTIYGINLPAFTIKK